MSENYVATFVYGWELFPEDVDKLKKEYEEHLFVSYSSAIIPDYIFGRKADSFYVDGFATPIGNEEKENFIGGLITMQNKEYYINALKESGLEEIANKKPKLYFIGRIL